ncbi:MAG TPA: Trm112 family protein [Desulfuromonadales bacterium]|nr:Trm112 family protein [Desulfuromonadales bacterium]
MLSHDFVHILACPLCMSGLEIDERGERLHCRSCRVAYPVRDGIPVLLADAAEPHHGGCPSSGAEE